MQVLKISISMNKFLDTTRHTILYRFCFMVKILWFLWIALLLQNFSMNIIIKCAQDEQCSC